ncbi:MAG: HD domain-containing protein [Bdellovibrionaceae bacterium]|nr:HD domain-containing protein [Bdellovibrionales bacterium]MCB9086429.1 HD domain-containing protein [Pseudobdellovibrionaceae bacterium]
MEIRDPIHGSLPLEDGEVAVLDTAVYQRLRAIKQLGFMEFSFPGATHSRYLHSLGVCHLAGQAFDHIFAHYPFRSSETYRRLKQSLRLAALLHDVGHGPLSHTTEEVMPPLRDLGVGVYKRRRAGWEKDDDHHRQANHEDYTIKFLTDSSLTPVLKREFPGIDPLHIACLVDKSLECPDDFFREDDHDFRTILSQIVSSEMDVDRMDYLERDAYFCGTNYGRVELNWLLGNLTYHEVEGNLHLALNRRALYTFDDFLLARHHMHLMVYFHHKSIIYEEMLMRYLASDECQFFLPSDIEEYIGYTDYALFQHLSQVDNRWARRVAETRPFRMLFEYHSTEANKRTEKMEKFLNGEGVETILASTTTRLSKYHSPSAEERSVQIYVVDQYDRQAKPYPIEKSTEIFQKYEEIRRIERIYVAPEDFDRAEKVMLDNRL